VESRDGTVPILGNGRAGKVGQHLEGGAGRTNSVILKGSWRRRQRFESAVTVNICALNVPLTNDVNTLSR
jgi:hypothetical protein